MTAWKKLSKISLLGLLGLVVAIDPARRLHRANNARRWSDVRAILESVREYQADHDGDTPSSAVALDSTVTNVQMIGEGGVACASVLCSGVVIASTNCFVSGLNDDLREGGYLSTMPYDPKTGSDAITRYYINLDANGFLTVGACDEEGEDVGGGGTPPAIVISR
mgnify:CR=1 FL=1